MARAIKDLDKRPIHTPYITSFNRKKNRKWHRDYFYCFKKDTIQLSTQKIYF